MAGIGSDQNCKPGKQTNKQKQKPVNLEIYQGFIWVSGGQICGPSLAAFPSISAESRITSGTAEAELLFWDGMPASQVAV